MGKRKWLRIFTAVLIAGMIFGGYLPRGVTAQVPTPEPQLPLAPGGEGVTADPLAKVDSELRTLAAEGGETPVEVYILAKEGADLSRVATVTEKRPFPDGAELVVATVLPSQIEKLASHPDVVAAEAFHAIEAPIPITPKEGGVDLEVEAIKQARQKAAELRQKAMDSLQHEPLRGSEAPEGAAPQGMALPSAPRMPSGITAPEDWYGVDLIGAKAAWEKGYTGEGVDIAIIDSGVDFGHSDLVGKQAVYESGPYDGWPIALDPRSMREYFYNGWTSWDNYWNWWDRSWYAGVHDVIFCAGGSEEYFGFNGYEYTIAQEIVDLSLSGEIRWSVHPDEQLYDFVWDWVPFILLDTQEAGVYDTLIADLNFDLWFDEHDQMTTKDNPVMSVDLGAYLTEPTLVNAGTMYVPDWFTRGWNYPPTWWGPPQNEYYEPVTEDEQLLSAGTWIWAPNHWTPEGATTLQDGIADVSGGMLYYIADGVLPVPGMDYLYPASETPLNGQLVAFMIGSYWASDATDHGTLCASAALAGGQIKDTQAATGERVQYDPLYSMDELLVEDFEAAEADWDSTGLWHLQANSACLVPGYTSPETAAVFNDEDTCTFNTGEIVSGTIATVGPFSMPAVDDIYYAELSFNSFEQTECGGGCYYDRRIVEASIDGGETWYQVWNSYNNGSWEGFWYTRYLDMTFFQGADVLLRFRFDSVDSAANDYLGWYVDDVQLNVWYRDPLKPPEEGVVQGPAPGAKIIAVGDNYKVVNGMQGFYDAYTFLAYGVDGAPNTGDEFVEIMSMSYGDGSVHNDGWDWESRLLSYYNQNYLPNTTMFASSGNGGPGFGTVNSPQGNTAVSVGASTLYGQIDDFGGALSIDQINDGDVVHFSGRGPDAMGRPDPDVVATGGWGAGDTPVNLAYGFGAEDIPNLDGGNAWYSWGGTSRSSPEAAGVMADIYQAYYEANGAFPDFETARQIMMSGAQDLNHDVLRQGAGRVNADTGTDIATGLGGVYVSPSLLSAGEYQGTHYESFGNVLFPGDTWTQTFTVVNPGATAATVELGDEMMMEIETQTYDQVVRPYLGTEDDPYLDPYYYYAHYFITADPSLTDGYAFVRVAHASPDAPPVEVCVDGGLAFDYIGFGWVTGYAPLPSGEHLVQVFAWDGVYDCSGDPVIEATLDLAPFGDYTVVATDFVQEITPIVLVDDNSEPAEGNAHVRFFHGVPDAPAVDVVAWWWEDDPEPISATLFTDVSFQEVTNYLPVEGDMYYVLEVRAAGISDVVYATEFVPNSGEVYTIFAEGILGDGIFAPIVQDTPLPTRPVNHGPDLVIDVPDGADFMEVEVTVPFELFDYCYDDPWPDSICYSGQHRYSLTVFDWTDRNADDILWYDGNGDEVVSTWYGDYVEVTAASWVTQTELSRFNYAYNHANIQGATVRLGDRDDIDNIVLGLVHNWPNWARDGEDYYEANPLQVKVVFYQKVDWPIVETSAASLTVPAGGEATFDATFTIPDDPTLYGVHEGAITVGEAVIPTTVNVAVPGDEMLFTLGGNADSGTPYDNSKMGPGYQWSGGVYEEGDWRFYYYDAETGLDQQYLYVRNQWGDTCGNMPTFNETLVWGPNFGDQFSMLEPDKYGPYGMQYAGGTWDANGPQWYWGAPRLWEGWYDGDGIPQPESRAWATLWDGLNQVQFRNVLMSGKHSCGEGFEATAGVFGVDAPETGIVINTDWLSGSFNLDAISPVDGLIAYAGGFGQEEWFRNQDVPQGKHSEQEWPDDLLAGWVHTFEVENTWGFEAETFGPSCDWQYDEYCSDIDLFLLYDANHDGFFNIYDNRERLASSRGWDSHEHIWYEGDYNNGGLQAGTYALVMYGAWVETGDQFDLRLNLYGGDKLNVEGFNPENNFVMDVTPGELQNLTVNWEVPENGTWQGLIWLGMPWEESPMHYGMPEAPGFYIPVTINAGGIVLGGTSKQVDVEQALVSHGADGAVVLTYDITIINDGTEDIWVQMTDLLPEGTTFHEQFVQDPDQPPGQGWWYVAKWWYDFGPIDYFWPGDYCDWGDNDSVQEAGDFYPYLCWNGEVGPSTSGKVHIQYQVKVLPGFTGTVTNKADFFADWGESYHEFFSRTAMTDILNGVFMPVISK